MSKEFDATLNSLIQDHATDWGHYIASRFGWPLGPVSSLDTDLSKTLQADQLLFIDAPEPYVIHLELESGHKTGVPFDLLRYNVVAQGVRKYPVYSVLMELRPSATSPDRTGFYELGTPGEIGHLTFRYGVIRIWEAKFTDLLSVVGLAPLSILSDEVVPDVDKHLFAIEDHLKAENLPAAIEKSLLTSTYFLSGLRYEPEQVARLIELTSMNLKDSKTYQYFMDFVREQALAEAKAEGKAEGEAKGKAEGEAKGKAEGLHDSILRIGTKRLGPPTAEVQESLQGLSDLDRLNKMLDAVLDVSSWDELAKVE